MTTRAAAPAARCRNCRRGSFIALPSGGARDNCGLMHRAIASIGEWHSVPASVALNEYWIGEEESAGGVTKMDNPGAGLMMNSRRLIDSPQSEDRTLARRCG